MSGSRLLDDLARALVEPVSRRRALRMLGSAAAAAVLPVGRAGAAVAADPTQTCQNVKGEIWTCPLRKYLQCGVTKGACIDTCAGPGMEPCGSGAGFDCCIDALRRDGYVKCRKRDQTCVPTCKAIQQTTSERLTECGEECCFPNEVCRQGRCIRPCPDGRPPCGTRCCKSGAKCAFSGRSRVCCPSQRIVTRKIAGTTTRFCCPSGTVRVGQDSCCPPHDRFCCEEDELTPLVPSKPKPDEDDLVPLSPYVGRTFCVRGKGKRL